MFRMANTPIMKNADINVLAAIIFILNMQIHYNISDIGISAYFRFMGAFAIPPPPMKGADFPLIGKRQWKPWKLRGWRWRQYMLARMIAFCIMGPMKNWIHAPLAKKPRYRDDKIGNNIHVKVKHSSYVTCICTYTLQDICHCNKEILCIKLRISICLLNILF